MQQFKDKIYNYEAEPPASAWNKISEQLQGINAPKVFSIPTQQKKSKTLFYLSAAAAVFIIVMIVFVTFQYKNPSNLSAQNKDSIKLNNQALEEIITASKQNKTIADNKTSVSKTKKYLTIAGPEGQPVKISRKVATLIVSADNGYPPKAVWNKKIEKWKQIMLTSTLSPTSTNLLDVAQNSPESIDNNE